MWINDYEPDTTMETVAIRLANWSILTHNVWFALKIKLKTKTISLFSTHMTWTTENDMSNNTSIACVFVGVINVFIELSPSNDNETHIRGLSKK
jgi:hypothetical protein